MVAGGDVEEAKTRKEWGLALRADTGPDDEDEMVDSKEDKSKKAQEEKRKMYRESERLMREQRSMIKPARVEKRSVKDLLAKVEARAARVVGKAPGARPAAEQGEQIALQPKAPGPFEASSVPGKMVAMDEDDDDDEIIIRGNTVPSTPLQLPRAVLSSSAKKSAVVIPATEESGKAIVKHGHARESAPREVVKSPKKGAAPPSKSMVHITSPPVANKKRAEMRNQLLRTAQSRSEHLICAERSGIKIKREAPPNFSREIDLSMQPDPFPNLNLSFIPSAKYVGSKNGYVFHVGGRGLGYYKDADEDEVVSEDDDFFEGSSKTSKVKLAGNDSGMSEYSMYSFCH